MHTFITMLTLLLYNFLAPPPQKRILKYVPVFIGVLNAIGYICVMPEKLN